MQLRRASDRRTGDPRCSRRFMIFKPRVASHEHSVDPKAQKRLIIFELHDATGTKCEIRGSMIVQVGPEMVTNKRSRWK